MFNIETEKKRSRLYNNIRSFFDKKDYTEVFTPSLSSALIPEPTIDTFKSEFHNPFLKKENLFLIPSPEVHMKKMLHYNSGSIYQISKCFRNSEQIGRTHNIEFSMLEYYTVNYTDKDSIPLTIELLENNGIATPSWLKNEPLIVTMEELFREYCSIDLIKAQDIKYLKKEADRLNLIVSDNESWEDTFNKIFLTFVEPNLPKDREVYVCDYPAQIECLAKNYPDSPYKKRWEMYIGGIEIANCYEEESDEKKISSLLKKEQEILENERKDTDETISSLDEELLTLSLPLCSGVAIGLDRLLMVLLGKENIKDVIAFAFEP